MNINEELLRIQYLVNYEKGRVISEQKTTTVTKQEVEGGTKTTETTSEPIKIPYSQDVTYDTGSNTLTPESYKSLTEGILTSINSNPESKKMLEDKNIKLTNISVMGSASNSWGNTTTGYDLENDRTTRSNGTPTDQGYNNNRNLANQRANILLPQIIKYLKNIGISVDNSVPKSTSSVVINTSGFTDNSTNRPPNLRPGQFISVNLTFNYIKVDIKETFEPRFDPKYIIQGSYLCNSKNGVGKLAGQNLVLPGRCINDKNQWQIPPFKSKNFGQICDLNITPPDEYGKYIAIYDIKYNTKLSTDYAKAGKVVDTKIFPQLRYNFHWEKGKITRISIEMNGKVTNQNIIGGTGMEVLKKYMDLPKYDGQGGYIKSPSGYEQYVTPYL
jgi:hypothetical protein